MIREASEADIPALVMMGERFIHAAGHKYDAAVAEETLRGLIHGEASVILVDEDCTSMLGGLVYQHFFNRETVAQELFWWASGGGRDLLAAFEEWAKGRGASKIMMICLEALSPDRVAKIYERRGYAPLERTFARTL